MPFHWCRQSLAQGPAARSFRQQHLLRQIYSTALHLRLLRSGVLVLTASAASPVVEVPDCCLAHAWACVRCGEKVCRRPYRLNLGYVQRLRGARGVPGYPWKTLADVAGDDFGLFLRHSIGACVNCNIGAPFALNPSAAASLTTPGGLRCRRRPRARWNLHRERGGAGAEFDASGRFPLRADRGDLSEERRRPPTSPLACAQSQNLLQALVRRVLSPSPRGRPA